MAKDSIFERDQGGIRDQYTLLIMIYAWAHDIPIDIAKRIVLEEDPQCKQKRVESVYKAFTSITATREQLFRKAWSYFTRISDAKFGPQTHAEEVTDDAKEDFAKRWRQCFGEEELFDAALDLLRQELQL